MTKNQIITTKERFIREVSKKANLTIPEVKNIVAIMEEIIKNKLTETDKDTNTLVKFFDGFSVEGIYEPAKQKTLNYTDGEIVNVPERIKVKPKVTNYYSGKISLSKGYTYKISDTD